MFGALIQINSFPSERALSLRERAAGTYYASAYFLAKTTAETLTQVTSGDGGKMREIHAKDSA